MNIEERFEKISRAYFVDDLPNSALVKAVDIDEAIALCKELIAEATKPKPLNELKKEFEEKFAFMDRWGFNQKEYINWQRGKMPDDIWTWIEQKLKEQREIKSFAHKISLKMLEISSSHVYFILQQSFDDDMSWEDAEKLLNRIIELASEE
jgi:hypothetical protein